MRVAAVHVFDKDISNTRGKVGGDELVKHEKTKHPVKSPRPNAQSHKTPALKDISNSEGIGKDPKMVLKKGSIKVLQAHLARITKAAPNASQDPLENKDEVFRQESVDDLHELTAGLDDYLASMGEGRMDMENEFGDAEGDQTEFFVK